MKTLLLNHFILPNKTSLGNRFEVDFRESLCFLSNYLSVLSVPTFFYCHELITTMKTFIEWID